MKNENTGRHVSAAATHSAPEPQTQVNDLAAQRAISEVLRAVASSPHDLQPALQSIVDSALHLCRADGSVLRIAEEGAFRLVAYSRSAALPAHVYTPPPLVERSTFLGRVYANKSPVHIPDFDAQIRLEQANQAPIAKASFGTVLVVPMLINDERIASLTVARLHVEPYTEKEIGLVTDFVAEAAIALEISRRERQLRELQTQLSHTNRVATIGQLSASITHEVNQPIASTRNNIIAALNFLDRNPADLQEAREALACAVKDTDRVGAIVSRMRGLMQKASPQLERMDINEAVHEVIELTRGEASKNMVSVRTEFAKDLPVITGDRVQLQQVMLNLIVNAVQALGANSEHARQMLITTSKPELHALCVGVQDTGPVLGQETFSRLFEPFYTTKPNGMGMGLTISRSIIEAHGGRLWATACQPHGALFQFTIPVRPE